jgi:hypothetical protein
MTAAGDTSEIAEFVRLTQVLDWSRGIQQILRLWARQMHLRASRTWRADQALGVLARADL